MPRKREAISIIRRRNIAPVAIIVGIVAVIIGTVLALLIVNKGNPSGESTGGDVSNNTTGGASNEDLTKGDKQDNTNSTPRESGKEDLKQYEGDNPNASNSLSGIINYAGEENGKLSVRVSIDQFISGKCTMYLANTTTGAKLNYETSISAGPASSFCSFSEEKPGAGSWTLEVKISDGERTGMVSKEIDL